MHVDYGVLWRAGGRRRVKCHTAEICVLAESLRVWCSGRVRLVSLWSSRSSLPRSKTRQYLEPSLHISDSCIRLYPLTSLYSDAAHRIRGSSGRIAVPITRRLRHDTGTRETPDNLDSLDDTGRTSAPCRCSRRCVATTAGASPGCGSDAQFESKSPRVKGIAFRESAQYRIALHVGAATVTVS